MGVFIHENYGSVKNFGSINNILLTILKVIPQNDIMLMRIPNGVHKVKESGIMRLPTQIAKPGKILEVVGFGVTQDEADADHDGLPKTMIKLDLPVISDARCKELLKDLVGNGETTLCSGYEEGGKDACQGDSGGPLFFESGGKFVQHGVVSYGSGCAEVGLPGVFTEVFQYKEWIERTMANPDDHPGFYVGKPKKAWEIGFNLKTLWILITSLFGF